MTRTIYTQTHYVEKRPWGYGIARPLHARCQSVPWSYGMVAIVWWCCAKSSWWFFGHMVTKVHVSILHCISITSSIYTPNNSKAGNWCSNQILSKSFLDFSALFPFSLSSPFPLSSCFYHIYYHHIIFLYSFSNHCSPLKRSMKCLHNTACTTSLLI